MRRVIVLCLLMAGCAAPPLSDAELRRIYEQNERDAERSRNMTPAQHATAARDAQADTVCRARAEMAAATYSGRGVGLTGALVAGTEAGIAAERVRAACWDAYRATGILPSF